MENILNISTLIVAKFYRPILAGIVFLLCGISVEHVIVRSPVRPLVIQMSLNEPPRIAFMLSRKISQNNLENEFKILGESKPLSALHDEAEKRDLDIQEPLQISVKPMVFVAGNDFRYPQNKDNNTEDVQLISEQDIENIKKDLPPGLKNRLEMAKLIDQEGVQDVVRSLNRSPANAINEKFKLEGLPYFPGYQFDVRVVENGVSSSEAATINPETGDIFLQSSSGSGKIVVDLYDDKGNLVGQGEKHRGSGSKEPVNVKPTREIMNVARGSIDFDRSKSGLFAQNMTSAKGKKSDLLEVGEFYRGSWMNLRSEASTGLDDTVMFIEAGKSVYIPHLESKTTLALKEYVAGVYPEKSNVIRQSEIVIGQIEGKNVSDIQIEVIGRPDAVIQYFTLFPIPDQNAKVTYPNGYFSIFGLEPESYQIVLKHKNQIVGFANFTVENSSVSAISVKKMEKMISKTLVSYDAFSGSSTKAQFGFQFSEQVIDVDGSLQLLQSSSANPTFTKVLPMASEYLPMVISHSNDRSEILSPQVTSDWISKVLEIKEISQDPEKGVAIVFFTNEVLETEIMDHPNLDRSNRVYFDYSGNPVDQPVVGGGVLVFNLPEGISNFKVTSPRLQVSYLAPILGQAGAISTVLMPF